MDPFQNVFPLDDQALDQLEQLLNSPIFNGEAMRLDELQGLLCAIVSAPEPVLPSEWLPAALGAEPTYGSEAQMQQVMDLMMRLYNEVAAGLYRGEEPELILYPAEDDSGEPDFGAWADGFLYGSHLGKLDWLEAAGDHAEDLSDLMEDFFLLNGAIKEDVLQHGEEWMSETAERQALQLAAEGLPSRVLAVYDFWRVLRSPVEPLRRDASKVGRNEPCPCGSGRKFKQCCGDPKRMH